MREIETQGADQNRFSALIKKAWDHKLFRIFVGGVLGAGAGWLYWEFIGCNGGSCPLTSNAPQTIIIFSLFGMWYNFKK